MGEGAHLVAKTREVLELDLPDRAWMERFLEAVGSEPGELPPEILDAAPPLVPLLRRARPAWDVGLPVAELASATYPKLVVSGGHSPGFEAICDDLAARIGASRSVTEGAGHEIQFTGQPINDALLSLWRTASAAWRHRPSRPFPTGDSATRAPTSEPGVQAAAAAR